MYTPKRRRDIKSLKRGSSFNMESFFNKVKDAENIDEVDDIVSEELDENSPEEVLVAVTEMLGSVVEQLTAVEDNKSTKPKFTAARKASFVRKLKDTEDTESVIELAKQELSVSDPADVVETVIEVLDDVISNLEQE